LSHGSFIHPSRVPYRTLLLPFLLITLDSVRREMGR
jgi:hypothetical protein